MILNDAQLGQKKRLCLESTVVRGTCILQVQNIAEQYRIMMI